MSAQGESKGSLSVLLAEDQRASRMAARRILERAGHRVTEVATGPEVIERVRRDPFDLVLMDIAMPGLDGIEVARRIRGLPPPQRDVPIVAVTGYVGGEDRTRCRAAGMNAFVAKPYRIRQLLAAIAEALGGDAPSADETREPAEALSASDFVVSARDDLQKLEEAVAAGDREDLLRLAHGLAGAAALWGVREVSELARELHAAAPDARLEELVRLVASLHAAMLRAGRGA